MRKTAIQPQLERQCQELAAKNYELEQRLAALQRELAERQQAEEQARRQQNDLRDLVENAAVGIHQIGPDGIIRWANQAELDLLGYTREEYLGRHIAEIYADQAVIQDILQRLQRGETLQNYEARLRCRDGSCKDVLINSNVYWENGQFIHTRCFTRDITERRQIKEALYNSEERFRAVVECAPSAMLMVDKTGLISLANSQTEQLFGYRRDELLGMSVEMLVPERFRGKHARHRAGFMNHPQARKMGAGRDLFCLRIDGSEVPVEIGLNPMKTAEGEFALISVIDITERKRDEQEREQLLSREQQARATAEAANRVKDEFLAVVSHELRAPLNAMLGWANVLKSGKYKPETLTHAVDVIERSARSQQQLIEDLLDSSRIISGKLRLEMQPLDLTMVIETALDTMRPAAEAKNITFETVYLVETDVITGDPERLQQVVWNLVSNAVKFTPNSGHVTIRLERVDPYLQLIVSDTGKGISREFLPHVFDRFHQADSSSTRRFSGLGLGLALVRHLVELHGGTASVDSPGEGLGTTFIINLPLRAVRTPAHETEPAKADGNLKFNFMRVLEGLRLLVVDDESDARDLIALMLEQQGAQVMTAASTEEALAVLKNTNGASFDCLISDIDMPEQDGYELMRRIRALAPEQGGQLPAVALTAYGRARDRIEALSAGFQMHVPKPVEPTELTMVIAGLTGRVGKGMSAG